MKNSLSDNSVDFAGNILTWDFTNNTNFKKLTTVTNLYSLIGYLVAILFNYKIINTSAINFEEC